MTKKAKNKDQVRRSTGMSPGQVAFNRIYSKRAPSYVDSWTDEQLLALLFGKEAARSILEACAGGTVAGLSAIGEGRTIRDSPGVGPGTAAKVDALYELACRIG